ncbi:MAG: PIN domain-containing protein [Pseudomonadota bacterium]|nr:PIN domain-containing protein [Pseudomonadota bacterium]
MTTDVETFIDTNVLLAATASSRPEHLLALAALEAGFAKRTLCLSGQVVREYLSVTTRPAAVNGLGLTQAQALSNVRQLVERARFLEEDAGVKDTLLRLLDSAPCLGKQIHDANIAATMIAHGIPRLMTLNPSDFRRFGEWIEVVGVRS